MNKNIRGLLVGLLIGMLGNVLGFLLFAGAVSVTNDVSFRYFWHNMFINTDVFRQHILTGALLVNVIIFYFIMRSKKDEIARGMMVIILLTVIGIVYYFL